MTSKKVYQTIVLVLTSSLIMLNFFVPASLAQESTEGEQIEGLVTTFALDPELGMVQLEELAEENPRLAVLIIVELAKQMPFTAVMAIRRLGEISPEVAARGLVTIASVYIELRETQPKLAATLKAVLNESIVQMVEALAGVAAVAVQSIQQIAPELGEFLEEEAIGAGLERDYLLAASPIMP